MPRSQEDFLQHLQALQTASAADEKELSHYARTGGERSGLSRLGRGMALGTAGAALGGAAGYGLKRLGARGVKLFGRSAGDDAIAAAARARYKMTPDARVPNHMLSDTRNAIQHQSNRIAGRMTASARQALTGAGLTAGALGGAMGRKPIPEATRTEEALREALEKYPNEMMYVMKGANMNVEAVKQTMVKSAHLIRDTKAKAQKLQQERDAALEKVAEFEREASIQKLAGKMEEKGFWSDKPLEEKVAQLRQSENLMALEELVDNQGEPIKLASVSDEFQSAGGVSRSDLSRSRVKDWIHS